MAGSCASRTGERRGLASSASSWPLTAGRAICRSTVDQIDDNRNETVTMQSKGKKSKDKMEIKWKIPCLA
jgi:hypothetical protein